MKKLYVLVFVVFLLTTQGIAQIPSENNWGLFGTDRSKITLNIKGTNTTYILWNNGTGEFNGKYLTYLTANTDIFKSINYFCQSWETNGAHVTGMTLNYRIYRLDGAPGDFIEVPGRLVWTSANGDKAWVCDQEINFAEGCEDGTTYYLELYGDFTGTPTKQCRDNNGGNNYKALFSTSKTFPVELTEFSAIPFKNTVKLNWATATEVNNFGFEIERKAETNDWQKIGSVEGAGTSNSPKDYSFVDKNPLGGTAIQYRLKQIDNDGLYKYYDPITVNVTAPGECKLLPNFPNPFNPTTSIRFQLSKNSFVTLKIYDALGREVATILNEQKSAGTFSAMWNGKNSSGISVPSGIYYCRITADNFSETRKMNLMK